MLLIVCAVQQRESVYIHPLPHMPLSQPTPHPITLGHHRDPAELPVLYSSFSTSYLLHTWECIYVNATLEPRILISFSYAPYKIQSSEFQTPSPHCRWQITQKWGKIGGTSALSSFTSSNKNDTQDPVWRHIYPRATGRCPPHAEARWGPALPARVPPPPPGALPADLGTQ